METRPVKGHFLSVTRVSTAAQNLLVESFSSQLHSPSSQSESGFAFVFESSLVVENEAMKPGLDMSHIPM